MQKKLLYLSIIITLQSLSILKAQDTTKILQKYKFVVFNWEMKGDSLLKESGEIIANSIKINLFKANCLKKAEILETENIISEISRTTFIDKMPEVYDTKTAVMYGKLLRVDYVIFGKMTKSKFIKNNIISLKILDVKNGIIIGLDEIELPSQSEYSNVMNKLTISIITTLLDVDDIFCDEKMVKRVAEDKEKSREKERMKEKDKEKQKVIDLEKAKNKYNVKVYEKNF
jgi:hypothetical protein